MPHELASSDGHLMACSSSPRPRLTELTRKHAAAAAAAAAIDSEDEGGRKLGI
jgi:hypothetical protein